VSLWRSSSPHATRMWARKLGKEEELTAVSEHQTYVTRSVFEDGRAAGRSEGILEAAKHLEDFQTLAGDTEGATSRQLAERYGISVPHARDLMTGRRRKADCAPR
jgi:hypothetical protein